MIHGVTFALTWFNPFVFIGLIALLAHVIQRKWALTVFVALSFLLILNLGYWQETMETLAQVLFATFVVRDYRGAAGDSRGAQTHVLHFYATGTGSDADRSYVRLLDPHLDPVWARG